VAQIGLSVGLVVVGAVLTGDFARQAAVDVGYHPKGVLTARMALSPRRHPDGGRQFLDLVLERLRGVPAVDDVALVFPGPGVPIAQALRGRVEGHGEESLGLRVVSRSYFSLLRIPILAGRAFTEADVRGAEPVVVVNEAFAKRYWGSARSAVGQRIATGFGRERTWGAPVTVIGVAGDIREASMMMQPEMCTTYSWAIQRRLGVSEVSFLLKGAEGKLPGLAIRLKRLVEEVDPYQPLYGVRALEDLVGAILIRTRLLLVVVAVFSVLATLLAAVGVYVVIAFAVTRRTQEFGIRLALGASRCDVLQLVLGQTVRLVGKGVILTLPLTFGAIWLSAAQLLGVTDTDPLACLWAVGIVGMAAVFASVAPAWRAIRLDPSTALRQE
jgi:predicted permease